MASTRSRAADTSRPAVPETADDQPPPAGVPPTVRNVGVAPNLLFETVRHPELHKLTASACIVYLRQRARYEFLIAEKSREPGVDLQPVSHLAAMDRQRLDNMVRLRLFGSDIVRIEQVSEDILLAYIRATAAQAGAQTDTSALDDVVRSVRIDRNEADPKGRIYDLADQYLTGLANAGFPEFAVEQPATAIRHLVSRLEPPKLRERMELECKQLPEHQRPSFEAFLSLTVERAAACELFHPAGSRGHGPKLPTTAVENKPHFQPGGNRDNSRRGGKRGSRSSVFKRNPHEEGLGKESDDLSNEKPPKKAKTTPKCLNPECNMNHLLRDCNLTSSDRKKELYAEYRKSKGKVSRAADTESPVISSVMFNATFGNAVSGTVVCDTGADVNLLPLAVLNKVEQAGVAVTRTPIIPPAHFTVAAGVDGASASFKCSFSVKLSVSLAVRHAKNLTLRDVHWHVPDTSAPDALLSRPLLEHLGLDVRQVLLAACDQNDSIDASACNDETPAPAGSVGRVLQQNLYHSTDAEDAGDQALTNELYDLDFGIDDPAEKQRHLDRLVTEAREAGLPEEYHSRLAALVTEYADVFRIRLGPDPPAKVPAMVIRLKEGTKPTRAKVRSYAPPVKAFLSATIKRLVEYKFYYPNPRSAWASAPAPVAKPPSYRMTVDHRPPNAATIPVSWPMPSIEAESADFAGAQHYTVLDFVSGYYQLPLAPESQDILSFITSDGVFTPTRTCQGATNSAANFQACVEPLFARLADRLKCWLDDFLIFSRSLDLWFDAVRQAFTVCREHGLFLSARKCRLYSTRARWCGRLIDSLGVELDPARLSGLRDASRPRLAGELVQYVHCTQWMASAIPDYARSVAPLRALLERAYSKSGKRSKRSVQSLPLTGELAWGDAHQTAFDNIQAVLSNAIKLSHRDVSKQLCVYTDASALFWAGVVTQIPPEDMGKPPADQRHEPLGFLSGQFNATQRGWSTFEQEAFAIVEVFRRMDYLFLAVPTPTEVNTDHRNLLFLYSPLALEPKLGRHVVTKVQRWALFLTRFSYRIHHLSGEENVFADIMTRWFRGYRGCLTDSEQELCRRVNRLALVTPPAYTSPTLAHSEWPSSATIVREQRKHAADVPAEAKRADGVWRLPNGRIWIPAGAHKLQLSILIVGHAGASGHRGAYATRASVAEFFYWASLDADVAEFCKTCLLCLSTIGGKRVARPLGSALHATRPNQVLHFDFLYIGPSDDEDVYVLLVRDDLSAYTWLKSCPTADAAAATAVLGAWNATFSAPDYWISDGGSHFVNTLMTNLRERFGTRQHTTLAYTPWSNGTAERCCREVLRALRALVAELKLSPRQWPALVDCVQAILNHSPLERLGGRCPLEAFAGLKPQRPLAHAAPVADFQEVRSLDQAKATQLIEVNRLQAALESLHRDVDEKVSKTRRRQVERHNQKTNVRAANFAVGDFVLVGRLQRKGQKLACNFTGPRRVTAAMSAWNFEVEDVLSGERQVVHASRLKFFRAEGLDVTEELAAQAQYSEQTLFKVDRILNLAEFEDGSLRCEVAWKGFDESENSWEPLAVLFEDVPKRVTRFLRSLPKQKLRDRALSLLNLTAASS